jgi:glutamine synthetase
MIVKEVAMQQNFYATFMPKPVYGLAGSGMHTHMSLAKGGKNTFYDSKDKLHLSKTAKYFMAGVLKHTREICSVACQWVNSYKRLVPGYEAPVYISWAQRNRSALVRIPMYKPGKKEAMRIEVRFPDPACNPYLVFSVMLAAGLDGIRNKYSLPPEVTNNVYEMTEHALGDKVFEFFIRNKKDEWDEYRKQVTAYEIEKYLAIL